MEGSSEESSKRSFAQLFAIHAQLGERTKSLEKISSSTLSTTQEQLDNISKALAQSQEQCHSLRQDLQTANQKQDDDFRSSLVKELLALGTSSTAGKGANPEIMALKACMDKKEHGVLQQARAMETKAQQAMLEYNAKRVQLEGAVEEEKIRLKEFEYQLVQEANRLHLQLLSEVEEVMHQVEGHSEGQALKGSNQHASNQRDSVLSPDHHNLIESMASLKKSMDRVLEQESSLDVKDTQLVDAASLWGTILAALKELIAELITGLEEERGRSLVQAQAIERSCRAKMQQNFVKSLKGYDDFYHAQYVQLRTKTEETLTNIRDKRNKNEQEIGQLYTAEISELSFKKMELLEQLGAALVDSKLGGEGMLQQDKLNSAMESFKHSLQEYNFEGDAATHLLSQVDEVAHAYKEDLARMEKEFELERVRLQHIHESRCQELYKQIYQMQEDREMAEEQGVSLGAPLKNVDEDGNLHLKSQMDHSVQDMLKRIDILEAELLKERQQAVTRETEWAEERLRLIEDMQQPAADNRMASLFMNLYEESESWRDRLLEETVNESFYGLEKEASDIYRHLDERRAEENSYFRNINSLLCDAIKLITWPIKATYPRSIAELFSELYELVEARRIAQMEKYEVEIGHLVRTGLKGTKEFSALAREYTDGDEKTRIRSKSSKSSEMEHHKSGDIASVVSEIRSRASSMKSFQDKDTQTDYPARQQSTQTEAGIPQEIQSPQTEEEDLPLRKNDEQLITETPSKVLKLEEIDQAFTLRLKEEMDQMQKALDETLSDFEPCDDQMLDLSSNEDTLAHQIFVNKELESFKSQQAKLEAQGRLLQDTQTAIESKEENLAAEVRLLEQEREAIEQERRIMDAELKEKSHRLDEVYKEKLQAQRENIIRYQEEKVRQIKLALEQEVRSVDDQLRQRERLFREREKNMEQRMKDFESGVRSKYEKAHYDLLRLTQAEEQWGIESPKSPLFILGRSPKGMDQNWESNIPPQ